MIFALVMSNFEHFMSSVVDMELDSDIGEDNIEIFTMVSRNILNTGHSHTLSNLGFSVHQLH